MRITIIAALADNRVIGRDGDIPWRLPEDWRHFKRVTMGHHLVMGRRTWESIGRALPGRTTIVVSRGEPELPPEVRLAGSLDEALEIARAAGDDEVFVAGGARIYEQALTLADRMLLTRVRAEPAGDTSFPAWASDDWRMIRDEPHEADERHAFDYSFQSFERVRG